MPLKVAARGAIPPFIVMEVVRAAAARAAAGGDVLHLEIGQPSTPAPRAVIDAAHAALERDLIGYTDALGVPALRARLAAFYRARYGVAVPAERIALTVGSSAAFLLAFLAAFEPGDRVVLTVPGYPAYRHILRALDIVPVELPVGPETGFHPTVELLEGIEGPLAGLIVASPANPTGTMLSRDDYRALASYCAARSIRLISDEIYHGITYGAPATSALEVTDDAVVINSFSKYFSMTGWRLGWMVLPADLVRSVECLAQNLFISASSLAQHAAIAAFDNLAELDANVRRYAANRALLLDALPAAGFRDFAPADGAFYLYADVGHLTNDSEEFCRRLLAETGVALAPGIDFDPARGHRYVRFSFAGATADMAEAARRLTVWRG
jgi:aspartate/methionine/tyrosine aminotransferase